MTENIYMAAIALLLPITAGILVIQDNPYHALVLRGVLGAVAALVYALFGGADVALTEALVGTMLSITLYAIAVRSSMNMRLGVLSSELETPASSTDYEQILAAARKALNSHHVRIEQVTLDTPEALDEALVRRDVHGILHSENSTTEFTYSLQTRIPRLYRILQGSLADTPVDLELRELAIAKSPTEKSVPEHLEVQS
ncbi:MAG: DUF4040 domain-containing protein [Cyanobacteria bacterium P01_H01_bin.15]